MSTTCRPYAAVAHRACGGDSCRPWLRAYPKASDGDGRALGGSYAWRAQVTRRTVQLATFVALLWSLDAGSQPPDASDAVGEGTHR